MHYIMWQENRKMRYTVEIKLKDNLHCTGCSACCDICPVNAITMQSNFEGFLYPNINENICIKCGKCMKICNKTNDKEILAKPIEIYAAVNKNRERLLKSSSGGVFSIIAEYVLSQNGMVAGCIFDENLTARHIVTDKPDLINKMRGSKYVQSDISHVYREIALLLKEDKKILFTGTPCQVAGLKAYLGDIQENLITIDLVCHGVPSPGLLKKHIKWRQNKLKRKITGLSFRNKSRINKGTYYLMKVCCEDKTKYMYSWQDPYFQAFLKGQDLRESCYRCPYAKIERTGDITLADYWSAPDLYPSLNCKSGVSLMLINTVNGQKILSFVKNKLHLMPSVIDEAAKSQGNLINPCNRPQIRDSIYQNINQMGYNKWANSYFYSIRYIKSKLIYLIGKCITPKFKKKIKKFISSKTFKK